MWVAQYNHKGPYKEDGGKNRVRGDVMREAVVKVM